MEALKYLDSIREDAMSRFLIEAMIQVTKGVPYTKIAFISGNDSIDYHKQGLQHVYYKVLSVKSIPADQELLLEYGDTQGNTANPDNVGAVFEPKEQIDEPAPSQSGNTP
jgi:hypothetical protein